MDNWVFGKAAFGDEDDVVRKRLLQQVTEKHALLDESVKRRISILKSAAIAFEQLLKACSTDPATVLGDVKQYYVGPHCGRDAALAMGWLETNKSTIESAGAQINKDNKILLCKHSLAVHNELSFLKQMALAAKVVAHVTSPMHKKLLNLCHNWLR